MNNNTDYIDIITALNNDDNLIGVSIYSADVVYLETNEIYNYVTDCCVRYNYELQESVIHSCIEMGIADSELTNAEFGYTLLIKLEQYGVYLPDNTIEVKLNHMHQNLIDNIITKCIPSNGYYYKIHKVSPYTTNQILIRFYAKV